MLSDFLAVVWTSVGILLTEHVSAFVEAALAGIVLAAICWFLCTVYTHLWNRTFHLTFVHQVFCACASILTLLFAIGIVGVNYSDIAASKMIQAWLADAKDDSEWNRATFSRAYDAVKQLGVEDFSNALPVDNPNAEIPAAHDESRQTTATIYADAACQHFSRRHPFLSKIVWSNASTPQADISTDVSRWFQTNEHYPLQQAVVIAADEIGRGLRDQTYRLKYVMRLVFVVLFLVAQAVPFALIGWAAYRDIKLSM